MSRANCVKPVKDSRLSEIDEDTASNRAEDQKDERIILDYTSEENPTKNSAPISLVAEQKSMKIQWSIKHQGG